MKNVEAARAPIARHHVAHGVVAHMAHMDAPRRIGEHLEHVIFRARIVVLGLEDLRVRPGFPPFGLGFAHVVSFGPHYGALLLGKSGVCACSALSCVWRKIFACGATKHDLPGRSNDAVGSGEGRFSIGGVAQHDGQAASKEAINIGVSSVAGLTLWLIPAKSRVCGR